MKKSRLSSPALALALVVFVLPAFAAVARAKPNIIFILGDDLGIGDIGWLP